MINDGFHWLACNTTGPLYLHVKIYDVMIVKYCSSGYATFGIMDYY